MPCSSCPLTRSPGKACGMMRGMSRGMKLGRGDKPLTWFLWVVVILLVLLVLFWIGRGVWRSLFTHKSYPGDEEPVPADGDPTQDGDEKGPEDDPLVPDPIENAVYGTSWYLANPGIRSSLMEAVMSNLQQQAAEMSRPLTRDDISRLRGIVERLYGAKITCFVNELQKSYPSDPDFVIEQLEAYRDARPQKRVFIAKQREKASLCGVNIDQVEALARSVLMDYFQNQM